MQLFYFSQRLGEATRVQDEYLHETQQAVTVASKLAWSVCVCVQTFNFECFDFVAGPAR